MMQYFGQSDKKTEEGWNSDHLFHYYIILLDKSIMFPFSSDFFSFFYDEHTL